MEQKQTDVVIKTLIEKQTTISTMESCTSGLIASMITDTEGASAIFPGGYVTYSNETKMLVGVDVQVLRQYGGWSGMESIPENVHKPWRRRFRKSFIQIFLSESPVQQGM